MQISSLGNFKNCHTSSFKGLIKTDNNTYLNTDHITSIVQNYTKKDGMPQKYAVILNTVDNRHEVCKSPIETVVKAYSEAAKSKDAVIDASNCTRII